MLLNENEVKTCLVYALTPILKKYDIVIKEAYLTIHEMIEVNAVVAYQERGLDFHASFTMEYKNQTLCFENIRGKIEYLFLQLDVISVLQQFIHDEKICFHDNSCDYKIKLPIRHFMIKDGCLSIELEE